MITGLMLDSVWNIDPVVSILEYVAVVVSYA